MKLTGDQVAGLYGPRARMPILRTHDPFAIVGRIDAIEGRLLVTFDPSARVTKEMFFSAWTGAGVRFLETETVDGHEFVRAAEVFEMSV